MSGRKCLRAIQTWGLWSKHIIGSSHKVCPLISSLQRGTNNTVLDPNLQPPSRPNKREMTDLDRQKEEEELQMALAISLQETSRASSSTAQPAASSSSAAGPSQQRQKTPPPSAPHTTAATVSRVRALYDFTPTEPGELPFKKGDTIAVLESVYKDWWKGSLRGQVGIFPLNYVEKLSDPTAEELQRDAQTEAEVFGQVKNVEKLLALLSTSGADTDVQHNEEITVGGL